MACTLVRVLELTLYFYSNISWSSYDEPSVQPPLAHVRANLVSRVRNNVLNTRPATRDPGGFNLSLPVYLPCSAMPTKSRCERGTPCGTGTDLWSGTASLVVNTPLIGSRVRILKVPSKRLVRDYGTAALLPVVIENIHFWLIAPMARWGLVGAVCPQGSRSPYCSFQIHDIVPRRSATAVDG